ncbi:MAG: ribbon-helix-helix domain-containing protein [Proteobacteria bacterium]|nr:ribbon-helix-helix domain-containing protein [Pseudomonadota bacterium]
MAHKPRKRSLTIAGHRTSISLEDDFWEALNEMAITRNRSVPALIAAIDATRGSCALSSAIRSAVLAHSRAGMRGPSSASPPQKE